MDEQTAATDQVARAFTGLPEDVSKGQVLTALKRAAPYIGIKPRLIFFVDTLMSWSRELDWTKGERPVVFPSNDKLSRKLGVCIRQVQKTLTYAARHGLITHKESANGNRVGARGTDGRLRYAYGIDLSPLGARYEEFVKAAEIGIAADQRIEVLRKRLTAARRRINSLAQLVEDEAIDEPDAPIAVEICQLAVRQMRKVRDETLLTGCVEQIEVRADALGASIAAFLAARKTVSETKESSPSDDSSVAPNTTTNQPETAKADYSSSFSIKSSKRGYDVRDDLPQTEVEADLAKHGVDPQFIATIVPDLNLSHKDRPTWGELIGAAERLVGQASIHRNVWHEACRLMGQKGAAASVIATAHKHSRGDVDRPGAYLRGMNNRASKGSLNLGRTFHGLKDSARVEGMRALAGGSDARSIGQLAAAALGRARSPRGSLL